MVAAAVQSVSHAVAARALPPPAPESGAVGAPPSAAHGELDPAVVNHVGRTSSADASAAPADGRAAPEQAAEPAQSDEVQKLRARDAEVRAHERAHAAAGGALAGAPSYQFERGPDGQSYAVSGEVSIDISAVSNDPQATVSKMLQVKRAALAPASPSDADRAIAAMADAQIIAARLELARAPAEEQSSTQPANAPGDTARAEFGSYEQRSAAAAAYRSTSAPAPGHGISVAS